MAGHWHTTPNDPAAIHLITLLDALPIDIQAYLALPNDPFNPIPGQVEWIISPTVESEPARLAWKQVRLPRMAKKLGADIIHFCAGGPALFKSTLVSPAGYDLNHC